MRLCRLPDQLQPKLNLSGKVGRHRDPTRPAYRRAGRSEQSVGIRKIEVCFIEYIENLGSKLRVQFLRDLMVLYHGKIEVYQSRRG